MGQAQGRTIAWLYKHVGLFCFIHIPNSQILSQVSNEAFHMQLEVDKSKMKQASPPQENELPRGNKILSKLTMVPVTIIYMSN
jgi:hypothetical protein